MVAYKGHAFVDEFNNLAGHTPQHACMYAENKAMALHIDTAGEDHAVHQSIAGDVSTGELSGGWTVEVGRNVDADITSEADNGSGLLRIVTSAVHGLVTGDLVCITKANDVGHNKPTVITKIDDSTFDCDDIVYIAGAGVSSAVVDVPAYLKAGANSAGIYWCSMVVDGTAAIVNKSWKFQVKREVASVANIVSERTSTNTLATMSCAGIFEVFANYRIWISGINSTDATDYTIKNFNLSLHKIG